MEMKRSIIIFAVGVLTLTACSAFGLSQPDQQGKLSPMTELAIGMMKLDGTDGAITKEQAAALLPMWEVYRDLSKSDTAAQAEIDGLTEQIQETITADQRQRISKMKLSMQDMFTVMQKEGANFGGQGTAQGNRGNNGTGGPGFPGGGFPGGGPPDAGGFGGEGFQQRGTQTPNGAQTVGQGSRDALSGIPTSLLNPLIEYLQKKAAS
jgi:hypothetical protein